MSAPTGDQLMRIVRAAKAAWKKLAEHVPISVLRGDELAFKAAFLGELMDLGFGVLEPQFMFHRDKDGKVQYCPFNRPVLTNKPDVVVVDMSQPAFDLAAVSRESMIVIEEKFYQLAPAFSSNVCRPNDKNGYLADVSNVANSNADIFLLWCASSVEIRKYIFADEDELKEFSGWTRCEKIPFVEVKQHNSMETPFSICKKDDTPTTPSATLYVFRRTRAIPAAADSTPVKGGKAGLPSTEPKTSAAASRTPAQSSAKVRSGTGPAKARSSSLVSTVRKLSLDDDDADDADDSDDDADDDADDDSDVDDDADDSDDSDDGDGRLRRN